MDTFDAIVVTTFIVTLLPVAARLTVWRVRGRLLRLRAIVSHLLLWAVALASLSATHHWHDPRRPLYLRALAGAAVVINLWNLMEARRQEREKEDPVLPCRSYNDWARPDRP